MRCPTCGHENSSLATRCASCGAILPTTITQVTQDTTAQRSILIDDASGDTAEHARAPIDAPAPTVGDNPKFREVAGTAGKFARGKSQAIGTFFSTHQRALGISLALGVVAVLGIVWLVIYLFDAPAYQKIEADLSERMGTYEYAGGTYGPDLVIPLSSIAVTQRSSTRTPEGLQVNGDIGPTAYDVEAEATFDDGCIRVVRDVAAVYVRSNDAWSITGELAEHGLSLSARSGVDENKVLENVGTILNAASAQTNTSLSDIYADGSFSIVSNVFKQAGNKDTATDEVTIHCSKESGFYSYEGNIRATFAFESGTWSLRNATADDSATTPSYAPLVGTWTGSVVSTKSDGSNCYGAQEHPLELSIETVGDPSGGSGQVQGTISVLAHYHKRLEHDQATHTGDTQLENISFTGTIETESNVASSGNLVVDCTTTGSPEGTLDFTLVFGTDDDPSAVFAYVTSTHEYEESLLFFIPYPSTAEFTDTYILNRT